MAVKKRFRISGYGPVERALSIKTAQTISAGSRGLLLAGWHVIGVAVRRAPVDTGNLRNSHYVQRRGQKRVELGFTASYAGDVHENLTAFFKVGGPKFLESALQTEERTVNQIIRAELERVL